jgi:hypothetical protein
VNTGGGYTNWGLQGAALNFADHPPHIMYTPRPPQPNFGAVDMDELSASLGLPSAKKEIQVEASPARSQKSRSSQGIGDGLRGKLIDRALAKPLTPQVLARYLCRRSSSEDTTATIRELADSDGTFATSARNEGSAMKVVAPPPGFANETPRMIAVEENASIASAAQQPRAIPTGPAGYQHPHRPSLSGTDSPFQQHHARQLSDRRRPRRQARTRRTDQGPEPSSADIYPDDARWEPRREPGHQIYYAGQPYNMQRRQPSQFQPAPQPELRVEDTMHWPTPAEVHQPVNQPSFAGHPAQAPNTFECRVPPTVDDMSAADDNVHTLLSELPSPSVNTIMHFGALDLLPDDRPLTPDQLDGKRYGMQYYGLGIGDEWQLGPVAGDKSYDNIEPFRVRPRNHEGWGGWEWAVQRGWANE